MREPTEPDPVRIGWIVDVQRDFMRPDGRLYVKDLDDPDDPGAVEARAAIERAVETMEEMCEVLVYTGDWHGYEDEEIDPEDPDPEAGTYPPHCMGRSDDPEEREGALIIESVRPASPVVLETGSSDARARQVARRAVEEGRPVFVRKVRFDVFEGNPAAEALVHEMEELLRGPLRFYVAGVARDVCVTRAIDGLQARGYDVVAIRDATWGLGLEDERETLDRWREHGGEIATTERLTS